MIESGNQTGNSDGLVFNIQKFSLHDGTGIRTLVFLKGCPLNCRWCANPEGKAPFPEIAYNAAKCIGGDQCDECIRVCPRGAVYRNKHEKVFIDRHQCDNCGLCADRCPSRAIELLGKRMTADDIIRIVEEDGAFYHRSGGGLTLSGGEPLDQIDFSLDILKAAKSRGMRTAVETSGLCRWETLEIVCRHTDQIFFDIKTMDNERHIAGTGVANTRILKNFRNVSSYFPDLCVTVRTPVIPGFNDTPEAIGSIRKFVRDTSSETDSEILPYHRFGESKYGYLGMDYPLKDVLPLPEKKIQVLRKISG
jgi:pyruvate formate lyase activating enzyme